MDATATQSPTSKPPRKRRWVRGMFWLGVGLITFWFTALLLATWDLANAREALRRRGHPATYEEVVERLYATAPRHTGVDLIRKALAEDKRLGSPGTTFMQMGSKIDLAMDESERKLLAKLAPQCATVLPLIQQAVKLPPGPFTTRDSVDTPSNDFEDVQQIRNLSRLMWLPIASAAEQNDYDETVRMLSLSFDLTGQLAAEQRFIPQLIRIAMLGVATNYAQKVLPSLILNEDRFRSLDMLLASIEANLKLQQCLINERAALASLFEAPTKLHEELRAATPSATKANTSWSDASYTFLQQRWADLIVTPLGLPARRRAAAQTLRVPDDVLALVDSPRPNNLSAEIDHRRGILSSDRILLDPGDGNTIGVLADAALRTRRRLVITRIALRVKWYAHDHGRLPNRLEQICDAAMPGIPTKWFEGKPFTYTKSDGSFRIDSVDISPEVARPASIPDDEWRTIYGLLIKMDLVELNPSVKGRRHDA